MKLTRRMNPRAKSAVLPPHESRRKRLRSSLPRRPVAIGLSVTTRSATLVIVPSRHGCTRPRAHLRRQSGARAGAGSSRRRSPLRNAGGRGSPRRVQRLGSSPFAMTGMPEVRHGRDQGTGVGMLGISRHGSAAPISTISPRYMTAMRSATKRATARSWVTKMTAIPSSSRNSPSRFNTVAASETSSELVGSSQSRIWAGPRSRGRSRCAAAVRRKAGAGAWRPAQVIGRHA